MGDVSATEKYKPPSFEYLKNKRSGFLEMIGNFATFMRMKKTDFQANLQVYDDVSTRVHQRQSYYMFFHGTHLEQSQVAASFAYWILRYRPIRALVWDKEYDVNVYFAYYVLFTESLTKHLAGHSKEVQYIVINNILTEYKEKFIRGFSEYNISKGAMMLIADSIKSILRGEIKRYTS